MKCGFKLWFMRHLNFKLFLSLFFMIFGAVADDSSLMPSDIMRIKQRGELIVAMYYDDVPLFCERASNQQLKGIDIEIAQDIAEKLNVKLVLNREARTFDEVAQIIAQGKADVGISSLSDTLDRAMMVRFTVPYWSLRQALLINRLKLSAYKDHPDFNQIERLLNQNGIQIGVLKGSSYVDFATKIFPLAGVVSYDSVAEGIENTKKAKVLAFLYDEVEVMNWSKQHPEDSLFLKSEFIKKSEDTLAMAVNWRDTHLLAWLNLYIQHAKNNFISELNAKYSNIQ